MIAQTVANFVCSLSKDITAALLFVSDLYVETQLILTGQPSDTNYIQQPLPRGSSTGAITRYSDQPVSTTLLVISSYSSNFLLTGRSW